MELKQWGMRFFSLLMILLQGIPAHAQSDTAAPAAEAPVAHAETPAPAPEVKSEAPSVGKPTKNGPPAKSPEAGAVGSDSSDYEIDYEEEPEGDEQSADTSEGNEEAPAPKGKKKPAKKAAPKVSRKAPIDRNAPALTGTRSKNRFAPMFNSETKSIYKKNGKALDVDTD
jgi:hypothetical protein